MSLTSLLNQTGTFEANTGQDRHGSDAYGTPVTAKVRFQQVNKSIMTATNERTPIDGEVYCSPSLAVSVLDRFTFAGQKYKVIRKAPVPGASGATHHIELLVQLWRTA